MDFDPRCFRRLPLVIALLASSWAASASADDWLVYLGGGVEPIEGGWDQRQGRVVFRKVGGTLVSIPQDEVDLPASAFLTYQLNGRLEAPPRLPAPDAEATPEGARQTPCVKGMVVTLIDSETLRVRTGEETETVHVACLDAPDTRHRFPELGWFGRATLSAIESGLSKNAGVCIGEPSHQQRDSNGHRIVYVTLASGKDLAAEVIGRGLGLLRIGPCERAVGYRRLEDSAIAAERGLWGPMSEQAALAVAGSTVAIADVDAEGGRVSAGGGRAGRVGRAPPRRRVGGG